MGSERGTPDRIRTGVTTLKGWDPRPLDDGGAAASTRPRAGYPSRLVARRERTAVATTATTAAARTMRVNQPTTSPTRR